MGALKQILLVYFIVFFSATAIMGQAFVVKDINIIGNDLTKRQFILRELLFSHKDTILINQWALIKKMSIQNLINTSLFHSASIELKGEGRSRTIEIKVVERWYLWPIPQIDIDERNFNTWWETKNLKRASAGVFLTHNNMRGRGEMMKVFLMVGHNRTMGLSYEFPYLNKEKTFGIGFQSIYTLRHEVNYITENNKQAYLKTIDRAIQQDWISAIQFTYRPKFYLSNLFQIRYHQFLFADTLISFNPNYTSKLETRLQYFGFYYKLKLDYRDYKPYPLTGYYADFEVFKYGTNIFDNNLNVIKLKTTLRKYLPLSKHWFAAIGFIGQMSNGKYQPYLFEKGLGYGRDFVRAYEYYVVDGQEYIVGKANIKYNLLQKQYFKINRIKTNKFNNIPISIYANVFSDIGYVNNDQFYSYTNTLPNTWLYSAGIGLDFVSYYDAVARIEWSLNALGDSHIYLHFIAPI